MNGENRLESCKCRRQAENSKKIQQRRKVMRRKFNFYGVEIFSFSNMVVKHPLKIRCLCDVMGGILKLQRKTENKINLSQGFLTILTNLF